jgi:hypothetical protein
VALPSPPPSKPEPPPALREVTFDMDTIFTPSYQAYTPTPTADLKYRSPDRRQRGVLAPPSTVSRPNIDDALRRVGGDVDHDDSSRGAVGGSDDRGFGDQVSVVVHKHITTCEQRLQRSVLRGGQDEGDNEVFQIDKMMMFHEDNFISPHYVYDFVQVPITPAGFFYT